MKIAYIARHEPADNQDEIAVSFALEKLGHTVHKYPEKWFTSSHLETINSTDYDFVLINKWENIKVLSMMDHPKFFWYWDMVDVSDKEVNDPILTDRAVRRLRWMDQILPLTKVGFCTDGDFVLRHPDKCYRLMQGADERMLGRGQPLSAGAYPPILFTGTDRHGLHRKCHLDALTNRYGSQFGILGNTGPSARRHGRDLANVFATAKVVVAPNGPQTDHYWSNRVYLTLGLGGFLLHPHCLDLLSHYAVDELACYKSHEECFHLIDYYLRDEAARESLREVGFKVTSEKHLYRHRCAELISVVEKSINGI